MSARDGGPAFPYTWVNDGDILNSSPRGAVVPPGGSDNLPGMSLRDYFAAAALPGLMAPTFSYTLEVRKHTARQAYEIADAMLAERAK